MIVEARAPKATHTPVPAAKPTATEAPAVVGKAVKNEIIASTYEEPKAITPVTRASLSGAQVGLQMLDGLVRLEDRDTTTKPGPLLAED